MHRKHSTPKSDETLLLPLDLASKPSHSPVQPGAEGCSPETVAPAPAPAGGVQPSGSPESQRNGRRVSSTSRVRAHRAALANACIGRQEMDLGAEVRAKLTDLANQAGMSKSKFAAFVLERALSGKSVDILLRAARRSQPTGSRRTV